MQVVNAERVSSVLDHSLARLSSDYLPHAQVRQLRWLWMDGVFGAISAAFFSNFVGLFAVAFGASNAQVGQLTAIASLCGLLALFPGARAIQWLGGRRKAIVLLFGGGLARLSVLAWALVPLLVHDPAAAIAAIIVLNALNTFGTNFSVPASTALIADIVPVEMRARFFSHRNPAINLTTLAAIPLAGWLIKVGNRPGSPFGGYQAVFVLAFLVGALATFAYSGVKDPLPVAAARQAPRLKQTIAALRSAPGFTGLIVFTLAWNFSVQLAGPFFNVYLVHHLGANMGMVGWLAAAPSISALIVQRRLTRLMDQRGSTWVQAVAALLIPILPVGWMLVTAPWQVTLINLTSGVLWTAFNLASFNVLLELAPAEARADAAAVFQFVVAASAVLGPPVGGYLADTLGFRPLFAISAVGRGAAAVAFFLWYFRPVGRRTSDQVARA